MKEKRHHQSRRTRTRRTSPTLPPHSWQAHPLTHQGEIKKAFTMALMIVAAVMLLVALLFVTSRFVGKAIEYTSAPESQAGIFMSSGNEKAGKTFTVPLTANIPSRSVGVRFTLSYNTSLTADCSAIFTLLDQRFKIDGNDVTVIRDAQCGEGQIAFDYVGLCAPADGGNDCPNALQGQEAIAEVQFTASEAGRYLLDFTSFDIISLASASDVIAEGHDAIITVAAESLPEDKPASGGGGGCIRQWNCGQWSYCNATLLQSKICTDENRCDPQKATKREVQSCPACQESWICTPWNACQNEQQTRNCVDEHLCGAVLQKPSLQKKCTAIEPSPVPVRVQPILPPPDIQQPTVVVAESFWDTYKWLITGIPAAVLLIALLLFVTVRALRPKQVTYNMGELREWVHREQQMGTSAQNIKDILAQHTGWGQQEIERAFEDLRETGGKSNPAG